MTIINITDAVRGLFMNVHDNAALVDARGNVVGYFIPQTEVEQYERTLKLFDLDEARRRLAAGGPTYTTAQVLEHLKSLGTSE